MCRHISKNAMKFCGQKRSIDNIVAMYEAQLVQKSLSNQAAFTWSTKWINMPQLDCIAKSVLPPYEFPILRNFYNRLKITNMTKHYQNLFGAKKIMM